MDSLNESESLAFPLSRSSDLGLEMPFRPDAIVVQSDVEDAYSSWEALARQRRQPAQAVWKSLETALARIRFDGQWGETIRQESIPTYFRERYGVSNLYCVDLAAFHRCFNTIVNRTAILLDIVDHPAYDRWFPGRRSR